MFLLLLKEIMIESPGLGDQMLIVLLQIVLFLVPFIANLRFISGKSIWISQKVFKGITFVLIFHFYSRPLCLVKKYSPATMHKRKQARARA